MRRRIRLAESDVDRMGRVFCGDPFVTAAVLFLIFVVLFPFIYAVYAEMPDCVFICLVESIRYFVDPDISFLKRFFGYLPELFRID